MQQTTSKKRKNLSTYLKQRQKNNIYEGIMTVRIEKEQILTSLWTNTKVETSRIRKRKNCNTGVQNIERVSRRKNEIE